MVYWIDVLNKMFERTTFKAKLIYELITSTLINIITMFVMIGIVMMVYIGPVNSGSMYPTMETGDLGLYIRRIKKPERYDIVSTKDEDLKHMMEKRIIGLPGETIEIKDGIVFINNKKLDDDKGFISHSEFHNTRNVEPFTIPEGEYYLLGDNRDFSSDSRDLGTYPINKIRYKQVKIFKTTKLKQNKEFF